MLQAFYHTAVTCCRTVQEAQPGARAHGYVTGVQDYGVFVGFCGDLRGLAPVSELGLPAGQRPSQGFKVGQVSHLGFAPGTGTVNVLGFGHWWAWPCPRALNHVVQKHGNENNYTMDSNPQFSSPNMAAETAASGAGGEGHGADGRP